MTHRSSTSSRSLPRIGLLALSLATITLTACGGGSGRMQGHVVEGPVSVVAIVESKDERLKQPGIADVKLEIRAVNSMGSRTMADGVSASDGSFELGLGSEETLTEQLRLTAKRDGYVTTQGVTFIPGNGRELLVVMKRSDRQTPGTQDAQTPAPTSSR